MQRILIFSTAYIPCIGGAEIAIQEITKRLADFEFVLVTAKLKRELTAEEQIENVRVVRIGKGSAFDKYHLIRDGYRVAKQYGQFDMVWGVMASYAGFAALRYKKRHPQVPFLLTLQEGDSRAHIYKHVWWCWWYFKQIFRRADYIQAISTYLADWAKEMGATGAVDVVPNGVEVNDQLPMTNDQITVRKKLGIADKSRMVVTVSRLVKKNGVEDLVRSFQYLPDGYHLLIIGIGELEAHLRDVVMGLSLSNRVHFIGQVSYDEVQKYLRVSDVFCRPSYSEGLGNAFLEAMAAGVPVVATRVGGIPDFLRDGETGWFCRVGDPKDISEKIQYVLDSKNTREIDDVVDRAFRMVKEQFSWESVSERIHNLFARMI